MLPNWVRLLVQWMSVVVFFAAALLLVQWVALSLVVTSEGYIEWAEGWSRVSEYWRED